MSRRIVGRFGMESGSGMMNTPEHLDELEERRAEHARLLKKGKREVTFDQVLDEALTRSDRDEEPEEEEQQGGRDPLLGLDPNQDPGLAKGKKGRAGKVIIKG